MPITNPETMRRLPVPIVAALALCTSLTGCGGSTTAARTPRTVTETVTAPATTTTAPATTTGTTASTTTTTTAGNGSCTAGGLTARYLGQNGATGNIVLEFALRNTGTSPCHTYGYPGVQFLGKAGEKLTTTPSHTTSDLLGSTRLGTVSLAPGSDASFRLVAATDAANPADCTTAYGLQVIAPDDTAPMHVTFPQGIYECARTTVSPLQPGTAAAPGV